jgi:SAM-dependent methyltransferase
MFESVKILCNNYPQSSWITLGDGRFGTSATYIEKHNCKAMATDIDTSFLDYAFKNKLISNYKYANAEQLPFKDNEFDFSFCKQAYHHFPRPIIAVYEMLRVSKKAVVLVEPADWLPSPIGRKFIQSLKRGIKNSIGKKNPHHDEGSYETVGNYVYTISEREMEKIALGLNLPMVAFKRFQDVYIEGVEDEMYAANGPLLKKIKKKLLQNRILNILHLNKMNNMTCIIFKEIPDESILNELKRNNFKIISLPRNPYL